ncbi:MAG: hypothetical protein WBA74_04425, partial [Cyclobacteriaceae bacterium]
IILREDFDINILTEYDDNMMSLFEVLFFYGLYDILKILFEREDIFNLIQYFGCDYFCFILFQSSEITSYISKYHWFLELIDEIDVNRALDNGNTIFHTICGYDNKVAYDLLKNKHKFDKTICNNNQQTPLSLNDNGDIYYDLFCKNL